MQANNVRSIAFGFVGAAVFWAISHSGPAFAQIQVLPAFVRLQATTPGTAQSGHANVTGTVIAGQFSGGGTALTGLSANNVTNGLLGSAFGGTGLNTVATPAGSLLRTTGIGTWGTLPVGADAQVLKVFGGVPQWAPDSLTLPFSATVSSGVAFSLSNTGGLDVIDAVISNPSSSAECFEGVSNGLGDVVHANMAGNGHAGVFTITNSSSGNSALETTSNGIGSALGATAQGSGRAARFSSLQLGTLVDVCGPNGSLETNGLIYRDYTASQRSNAIPIAYGSISSTGAVSSGTGNFTVTHTVSGDYDVTVTGEIYSNTGYTVSALPISNAARMVGIADGGTPFIVHTFDQTGAKIDTGFQFTVWRTDAVE